jgi:hypothetical protein
MAVRSTLRAGHASPPPKFCYRLSQHPKAIVRLIGLGKFKKNPMTSSRIEPATFRLVA